jgi:hypothetical protein
MKDYEPVMSFDEEGAVTYDDQLRGDEADTAAPRPVLSRRRESI